MSDTMGGVDKTRCVLEVITNMVVSINTGI